MAWRPVVLHHAAAAAGLAGPCQQAADWRAQHSQTDIRVRDIKTADAELALTLAVTGHLPAAAEQPGWRDQPWRTSHLRSWAATYRPATTADNARVPLIAVLHHAQLYDPHWPQLWRHHVLAWIASLPADAATALQDQALEDQARTAVHARGLHLES